MHYDNEREKDMTGISYSDFIKSKQFKVKSYGFDCEKLNPNLFDFQRAIVKWALQRGRAAIFADTGLGKTIMQMSWADAVQDHTKKPVLVLAPLAVAHQTVKEGVKFGVNSKFIRSSDEIDSHKIYVANYEQLKNIDTSLFGGVVLDESSILKGQDGKYRKMITESFNETPFKLSCTATPSPNDFMELGTQCEFLGIMSSVEMLAMFFIHDTGETQKWRLKGHGAVKFWEWLSTWSVCISNPADIGFESESSKYDLPPLRIHEHVVETGDNDGLFAKVAQGLGDRNKARKESLTQRCGLGSEIANDADCALVWCNLNGESDLLNESIIDSVSVSGSDKPEVKEDRLLGFSDGTYKKLVTKPKIAGYGMNWQNCNTMIFVGLSDSWEQYYQAIRRCWRFGQKKPVDVHIVTADTEGAVVSNIKRKQEQNDMMKKEMVKLMAESMKRSIGMAKAEKAQYEPQIKAALPTFIG